MSDETYDVVICGAGLAGLTLGWQLRQRDEDLSMAVIDRQERPLDEYTHKVGESTIPFGSTYLDTVLDLQEYLEERQFAKFGLRWFLGDPDDPPDERPEIGLSEHTPLDSWQLARGRFENDLREMLEERDVDLYEGYTVRDIDLSEDDSPHTIECAAPDRSMLDIHGRWAVDALGRRQLLRQKLGLAKETDTSRSASWFRLEPKLDVRDLAADPDGPWLEKVDDDRYRSTNHFIGEGYWVWVIPLSWDTTSVGIVAHDEFHPFSEFNTFERALEWLDEHEPHIADAVRERNQLDFRCMRNYSFNSEKFLSNDRWAMTGEAMGFADPWFSIQTNVIGRGNCFITDAILSDIRHEPVPDENIAAANDYIVGDIDSIIRGFELIYRGFDNSVATATCGILWVFSSGAFRFLADREIYYPGYLTRKRAFEGADDERHRRFPELIETVQDLYKEWTRETDSHLELVDFTDYERDVPFLHAMRDQAARAEGDARVATLEAVAQAIFLIAVEDTKPEHLERFTETDWLDAWEISLDPEAWDEDGLFEPWSKPGPLEDIYNQLRSRFRPSRDETPWPNPFEPQPEETQSKVRLGS